MTSFCTTKEEEKDDEKDVSGDEMARGDMGWL